MPYHEFFAHSERRQEPQIAIGGGARVARIFLPAINSCSAIRLSGRGITLQPIAAKLRRRSNRAAAS